MEKKYYFRGLGLGIIVTAIIMGIALSRDVKTRAMTDDEVIARAKELGMIEDSRLLEPDEEKPEEEDAAEAAPETPVKKDIAVKSEADAEKKDTAAADPSEDTDTPAETQQKPTVDTPEPVDTTTSVSATETKPKAKPDTNEMTKQDDDVNATPSEEEDKKAGGSEREGNADRTPAATGTKSITIASGDGSYTVAKKLEDAGVVSSASAYDTYLCGNGYDKRLRPGTFQIPAGATDEQIAKIVTGQ